MNQSFSRIGPAPARYSSRKPIFEGPSGIYQIQSPYEQEEVFKIVAKIRSLEDDVRAIQEQNRQIEADNTYMIRVLDELQNAVYVQENEIQKLTMQVQKESEVEGNITQYQQDLRIVGEKVAQLHELINDKTQSYEVLKGERDQAMLNHLRLKQECNRLQYQQNCLLQEINQTIELTNQKDVDLGSNEERKIDFILEYCSKLQLEITNRTSILESYRKEGAETLMKQKEKRIKSQYNIQLLRQRLRDYQQKKNYYKSCYNEAKIQEVINDMLEKQHSLRQQISAQLQKNHELEQESKEALNSFEKRIARQRADIEEQLKMQEMQNELVISRQQKILTELKKAMEKFSQCQEQGLSITQQARQKDDELFKKINELQSENIALQKELSELQSHTQLLQLDLNS